MGGHFEFICSARTAPGAAGVVVGGNGGGGGYPRPQRQGGRDSAPPALRGGCWEKIMATSVRSAKCRPPRSAPSAKERVVLTAILNLFVRIRGWGCEVHWYSSMILIIHCRFCHFSRGPAGGGGGGPTPPQGHAGGEVSQVRASTKKKSERRTRVR